MSVPLATDTLTGVTSPTTGALFTATESSPLMGVATTCEVWAMGAGATAQAEIETAVSTIANRRPRFECLRLIIRRIGCRGIAAYTACEDWLPGQNIFDALKHALR